MKQKFMPVADCAAFGWCYGRLAALAPELATPGRYANAIELPFIGWGSLNRDVAARKEIPRELRDDMGRALACVGGDNLPADARGQSAFALWYYRGLAGAPFNPVFDIAAARKAHGLTQQQLADAMGMQQSRVADWETGRRTPRPETLEKIKKILS